MPSIERRPAALTQMRLAERGSEQGGYATILEAGAQRPIITVMFVSASVFLGEYYTQLTLP
jgi:hypothetical protein